MCLWYWTAASETHQRKSNIFIIQLNNRSVKDRSFSRKIESEWSFFIPLKRILLRRFEGMIRCVEKETMEWVCLYSRLIKNIQ